MGELRTDGITDNIIPHSLAASTFGKSRHGWNNAMSDARHISKTVRAPSSSEFGQVLQEERRAELLKIRKLC
jgi:hypothetical protein